ncbi:MAG: CoA transferase subunit A [Candidatus Dadabacteria bacterium]|nr:CoA transferase subunit A [Candidatus Dadabacteria bacterium]NIV41831.1 CoA transferase subunit A [Candidatus Dadabacteria bacterium]NIX15762.1 CoA transferase subunit A [Candidatus Dadabacteria bacterium]
MNKIKSLEESARLVKDGDRLAIGGLLLQRIPSAFVRELARQGRKNLKLMKTAANYDFDLLCLAGCTDEITAGFVSFEAEFGLAPNFRKSVESEHVKFNENSCYTVISSLRAAAFGVPFMPIADLKESYLVDKFKTVKNPYTDNGNNQILTVPAIKPDWAVLHVQKSDEQGNAIIYGPVFEDLIMAQAANKTILTTEKIVAEKDIQDELDLAVIPGFKVEAVVEVPEGAKPASCYPYYDYSADDVREYLSIKDPSELNNYLEKQI